MAKIQRKTQKIFAGNTTADQITAFGTAKTASPIYTTDLDAIQTNVYTQGWTPSLMSDLAPYLQDSNALWYLVTTQLAYLFQQGIAEWDDGTEYTQGSIVLRYNNGELEFYMSLQNGNTNHQLTETGYWKKYDFNDKMNKDFSNATSQPWSDRLKTDHSNDTKPYIKTTYESDTSGYIIWSNGYCEQWGRYGSTPPQTSTITVNFVKNFKNTNYNLSLTADAQSVTYATNYFQANVAFGTGAGGYSNISWRACGYLASGQY